MQAHDRFDEMGPPKAEYEKKQKYYIMADNEGNITNVSDGLYLEMGLCSKFFKYTDSIFQQMINISKLMKDPYDKEVFQKLEHEGELLYLDTAPVISEIELE